MCPCMLLFLCQHTVPLDTSVIVIVNIFQNTLVLLFEDVLLENMIRAVMY